MNRYETPRIRITRTILLMGSVCGLLLPALPVRADVKIVSTVTVTHETQPPNGHAPQNGTVSPPKPETQILTAFYKGDDARTEISGGLISLYNDKSGQVSILDPDRKTYYVRSYQEAQEPSGTGAVNRTKVEAKVDINRGNDTKTLVGLPADVYILSGTVTISPQRNGPGGHRGFGGGGGGRRHGRGGGGFPLFQNGGNGPDGVYGGSPDGVYGGGRPSRTVEVSGEVWLSDALRLPGDKKATLLPFVQQSLTEGQLVIKFLADSLNKKKDIPLDSRITLTRTDAATGDQDTVTTTTHVSAVSRDPLSDALFQTPVGYTQIAPPAVAAPEGDNGSNGYPVRGRHGQSDSSAGDSASGGP